MSKLRLHNVIIVMLYVFVGITWPQFEWSGNYENALTAGLVDDELYFQDKNKVELSIDASSDEKLFFKASFVGEKYFGRTSYEFEDMLPQNAVDEMNLMIQQMKLVDSNAHIETSYDIADSFYIKSAYAGFQKNRSIIAIGVQPISWGCGYAWNPTDIWNKKNIMDPSYDLPGQMALRLEQGFGPFSITLVSGLEKKWEDSPVAAELKAFWLDMDWAITGARQVKQDAIMQLTSMQQYSLGGWISGQIGELGVHTENVWHMYEGINQEDYGDFLLGFDYTLGIGNGVGIMAEYLYSSSAASTSPYSFMEWMNYYSGDKLVLAKHNVYASINYPFDLSTVMLAVIANLSDGSFVLNPWISHSLNDNSSLDLMLALAIGDKNTQFGLNQSSATLRLSLFF